LIERTTLEVFAVLFQLLIPFMVKPKLHLRYLRPVALTSVLLLGLCAFTAIVLLREQAGTTASLAENLASRRASADLEESLIDLVGLLRNRVESVQAMHERIEKHLGTINRKADKPEEQVLAAELQDSYARYSALLKQLQQKDADHEAILEKAIGILESETLNRCEQLVDFNTSQIERSEDEHNRSLRRLAWGMAAVGFTGAIAGLVLGYGVARGLSMSIQRLQIGLRDAAGKLGPHAPEIVLTGEGDLSRVEEQVQELLGRVEQTVSRLQQREREVLRAEQLAAVGQLAAGVAHEIHNPLTSIKMLVQAGREDQAGLPPEDLAVIEMEVKRMERSLKVFLDFARMPKPEYHRQEITIVATRTLDLIRGRAAKQGVQLLLTAPHNPVIVEADDEQIQQVLVNLCLNALDVMPGGGTLEMSIRSVLSTIEIAVLDSGPGIAPSVMSRLFEPFVSTKETGVGLGLVISRRIVEEHGGRMFVANRVEGGASFSVSLPYERRTRA